MFSKLKIFSLFCFVFTLSACNQSIKPVQLYGEWKYIKVETPKNPVENMSAEDVALQNPSIRFTEGKDLVIIWGGERISHGKFRVEGKLIYYKENLAGGRTREFPFLVSKLTDKEIVFETMSEASTRVTAVRN
ncbi:MAG TPA: hypothetical protein VGE26_02105 [Sphingobacteriaceae bacterium]